MQQLMFHDDPPFWFETLRNLGLAAYGGSDVGGCRGYVREVQPGREPPLTRTHRIP